MSDPARGADGLLGQGEEFARLLAAASALQLPHALVIEGAPGSGKTTAARTLAVALLAEGPCDATRKQVHSGNHPDLHWLTVPEGKVEIPVEDVRAFQEALAQNPYASRARVAVIDPADQLNEQGQNTLLKTLEEPGTAVFLLLTTSKPEGLLPTVRSRVARYRMRPLAAPDLAAVLAAARPQADPGTRAWAAQLADGVLGLAQDLVDEPAARPLHARLLEFLAGGMGDPYALLDACLDGASSKEAVAARVQLVLRLLRASLRSALSNPGDGLTLALDRGAAYRDAPLDRWIESCERVFSAEIDLQQKIPAEQALLGLLLESPARL